MPVPPTQPPLQKRADLDAAKRQVIFLVSVAATIFILCPERWRIYRNLCIVPVLAWLTGLAFDMIKSLGDSWDNAPAWLKYFVPVNINVHIAAPFDQINSCVGGAVARIKSRIRPLALEAKARMAALKQAMVFLLIDLLDSLRNKLSGTSEHGMPHPAPDGWYGVLIMTPPVHDYGSFGLGLNGPNTGEPSQPILWNGHEVSSIPSIYPPSSFRVHLSFGLVPKEIWESHRKTLVEKFMAGLYWDISGPKYGDDGESWAQARIERITGIEVLGSIEAEHNAVDSCHEYFASLRQGWAYSEVSWNDVDFAIILGFLATGQQATRRSKDLFDSFTKTLRRGRA
ncbi:hypothetical protein ACJ41O_014248 [Fusarium nematophilum]